MQAIGGFKDSLERLLFSFVHKKLDTKIVKMVSDNVTGVDVGLGEECFNNSSA
jgi:hypothetical protein